MKKKTKVVSRIKKKKKKNSGGSAYGRPTAGPRRGASAKKTPHQQKRAAEIRKAFGDSVESYSEDGVDVPLPRRGASTKTAQAKNITTSWWADVPTLPKVTPAIEDGRGFLHVIGTAKMLNHPIGSVVVLYTEPNAEKPYERANHIHKDDAHLTFLLAGSMEYFERGPTGVQRWLIEAGTDHALVFTPPGVEHCMRFSGLFDTTCIVLADKHRETQEEYEADITRVPSLAAEWDADQVVEDALLTLTPESAAALAKIADSREAAIVTEQIKLETPGCG